jgi:predicted NBD/HSP70 family sugar kinase
LTRLNNSLYGACVVGPGTRLSPLTGRASVVVFTTVLTEGPVSRVEVSRRTGLSSAAVTKAARPFIEAGYLEEHAAEGRPARRAGRPASPLSIRRDREFFLGVKITHEELIAVHTDLGADVLVSRHQRLDSRHVSDVVDALASLVMTMLVESGARRERTYNLGVAVSGDIDRATGRVRYSPFLGWRDVELADALHRATGLVVTIENDVKALTLAEQWFGDGVGASSFALVTVGTGIGCGLVVNGGLVRGVHGVAGEIGHIPVDDGGPRCHCGGQGCVEAIASTEAILTAARQATGRHLTIEEAIDSAHAGDRSLRAVFARAGHAIGLGLAAVANLVGPQRIIVSGEGLAAYDLFDEQVRTTFTTQAFGAAGQCDVIIRPLPFEEWARGAAAASIQTLFSP